MALGTGVVGGELVGAVEVERAAARLSVFGLSAEYVVDLLRGHGSVSAGHSSSDTERAVAEDVALWGNG